MAIVYRHIRKDTNVPFYVGISTHKKRAFQTRDRSVLWEDIVKQTDYSVHILFEDVEEDFARQKEIEFITLYKRIKDGGTLCNKTLGGAPFVKHSAESLEKMSAPNKGKTLSDKHKEIISSFVKTRPVSLETKAKMSEALSGDKNPHYNKKASEVTKQRMKESAKRGSENNISKLTENDIINIRKIYKEGKIGHTKIGRIFGVGRKTISSIINNKTWTHV